MSDKVILLAAGGTGGHLFPAEALAGELQKRGWIVDLATDERGDRYGFKVPARQVHIVPSDTLRSKNPVAILKMLLSLGRGVLRARAIIKDIKPAAVVGFGGYPSFPPQVAAWLSGTPSVLHEANAVMGRANRKVAGLVSAVALSWAKTGFVEGAIAAKARHVGVPVRLPVIEAASIPYPVREAGAPLRVLVVGGSQGARVFSDLVPPALALMAPDVRAQIALTQQVRTEDMERVRAAYADLGVSADLQPFFKDMPQHLADSHLVVSRSGASTVAELAVIGRPAILVPLPHALDNDQLRNAQALEAAGGAIVAPQAGLTPAVLAKYLTDCALGAIPLAQMASDAKTIGLPDAVSLLADLVEQTALRGA